MSNQSLVLANVILSAAKRLGRSLPKDSELFDDLETIEECASLIKDDNKEQA